MFGTSWGLNIFHVSQFYYLLNNKSNAPITKSISQTLKLENIVLVYMDVRAHFSNGRGSKDNFKKRRFFFTIRTLKINILLLYVIWVLLRINVHKYYYFKKAFNLIYKFFFDFLSSNMKYNLRRHSFPNCGSTFFNK